MATDNLVVNAGLDLALNQFAALTATPLISWGVDDLSSSFVAGTTTMAGTNVASQLFDSTPTLSSQTVTATTTFATGAANFTHKRGGFLTSAASTTSPLTGLYGGISTYNSVGIVKTSAFSFKYTVTHTSVNVGTGNNLWVNQGLQDLIGRLFATSGFSGSTNATKSMGFDDGSSAYAAGDTSFTGASAAISRTFTSTPTETGQTLTMLGRLTTSDFNGKTIKRLNVNRQTSNVAQTAGAISGLQAGVSGQTLQKTSDVQMDFTMTGVTSSA